MRAGLQVFITTKVGTKAGDKGCGEGSGPELLGQALAYREFFWHRQGLTPPQMGEGAVGVGEPEQAQEANDKYLANDGE